MDELDIRRSATAWIKSLGFTAAAFDAGHRSKDLRDQGDLAGAEAWAKIETKIKEPEQIGDSPDATKH